MVNAIMWWDVVWHKLALQLFGCSSYLSVCWSRSRLKYLWWIDRLWYRFNTDWLTPGYRNEFQFISTWCISSALVSRYAHFTFSTCCRGERTEQQSAGGVLFISLDVCRMLNGSEVCVHGMHPEDVGQTRSATVARPCSCCNCELKSHADLRI